MNRELHRNPPRVADARLDALGELNMDQVAGGQIAAGLSDADDRLAAAQLLRRDA
ncbi:hypothetical protein D3C73_959910 [compost metagenome]